MEILENVRNYIGGAWIESSSAESIPVENPATQELIGRVPLSGPSDIARAVTVAHEALWSWRRVPVSQRAQTLSRFKILLDRHFEELARTVTVDNGKTLDEARVEIRRGIETVAHACSAPSSMLGTSLEDVTAGVDCQSYYQPVGVFAAITPVCAPVMAPLWFLPYAVATGNTFILKPSEGAPMVHSQLFELAHQAGIPAGVVNLVHGDRHAAQALIEHPDVVGVSFVGTSAGARDVYQRAASHGKRVQAFGGAHNHCVVMPDADLGRTVDVLIDGSFGCSGQRCLAGSVVIAVGDVYDRLRERLISSAGDIQLGAGLEPGVDMGPLCSGHYRDRVLSLLHAAELSGAKMVLDGRCAPVPGGLRGHFLGPSIVEGLGEDSSWAGQEMYGPVMRLCRARDLSHAISMIAGNRGGGAASIFTQNGRYAREFRQQIGPGVVGINVSMAMPTAFFPFGGTKGSFYGDLKAQGEDAFRFFTDAKVVISRWF